MPSEGIRDCEDKRDDCLLLTNKPPAARTAPARRTACPSRSRVSRPARSAAARSRIPSASRPSAVEVGGEEEHGDDEVEHEGAAEDDAAEEVDEEGGWLCAVRARKVTSVMGCALSRQLSVPGVGLSRSAIFNADADAAAALQSWNLVAFRHSSCFLAVHALPPEDALVSHWGAQLTVTFL
ncbi:hypothetical protein KC320_g247 [Hortaea werneckii]|nr:hypothetical protein KC320_g247 [Hortaea werneckii]